MPKLLGTTGLIVCAVLCFSIPVAKAGPCSEDIAQFEAAIRQSAGNPNAGLTAPQSVGAQLNRQPTPASLKQAQSACNRNSRRRWPAPSGWMPGAIARDAAARLPQPSECIFFETKWINDSLGGRMQVARQIRARIRDEGRPARAKPSSCPDKRPANDPLGSRRHAWP